MGRKGTQNEIRKFLIKKDETFESRIAAVVDILKKASIELKLTDRGDYCEASFVWNYLEVEMKCQRNAGRYRKIDNMDWELYDTLKKKKLSDDAIARHFGISRRTICRLKSERKNQEEQTQ